MLDPAPTHLILAQVSEVTGLSTGLSTGGAYFIAAVLAAVSLALYRELAAERALRFAQLEKHNAESIAMLKENMPLAYKLAEGVQEIGRIADRITKD